MEGVVAPVELGAAVGPGGAAPTVVPAALGAVVGPGGAAPTLVPAALDAVVELGPAGAAPTLAPGGWSAGAGWSARACPTATNATKIVTRTSASCMRRRNPMVCLSGGPAGTVVPAGYRAVRLQVSPARGADLSGACQLLALGLTSCLTRAGVV